MSKITTLYVIPNPKDSTSLYRGVGPLSGMRRASKGDFNYGYAGEISWPVLQNCDLVYLQRPYRREHLEIAQMARASHVPVWVDYDDFLFDVPEDNPAYGTYMNDTTHSNVVNCIRCADVVTVSTKHLKRLLQKDTKEEGIIPRRCYVVPNAWNDKLFPRMTSPSRNKLVAWRGSDTHQRDLLEFAPEIIEVAKAHPDWTFQFIGYNPWFITSQLPKEQCVVVPPLDPIEYMQLMSDTNPSVLMVPLHDSHFNRAKSNIAWIEGTLSGATVVGPDWEEWRNPGSFTYRTKDDFKKALNTLMSGKTNNELFWKMSADELYKKFKLSELSKFRLQIAEALLGNEQFPDGWQILDEEEGMEL